MRQPLAIWNPARDVWEQGGGSDAEPALRALGRVLGDLASLGYSAQWRSIRASDIGAPHHRERVFVLAGAVGTAFAALLIVTFIQAAINIIAENN